MISKNQIKLISSLSQKKFRDETGLFIAEGTKLVLDLLPAFECKHLFATPEWLTINKNSLETNYNEISDEELKRISGQKSPQGVLAVFNKNNWEFKLSDIEQNLSLALDDVQDPGNLGTILRIADWFGIQHVFCSEHCADVFNPKTVQATMGALARVKVHYVNLGELINSVSGTIPIYGTFMDGKNVYSETLSSNGIVVMGNEGNGISAEIDQLVTKRLLIPNYPEGQVSSESLNVGVATALICAEFRRRL